ncbi:hypothetical protein HJFPF1_09516 [Paramyrothecium foliicola]|nr:hypothetical protein HJFPF1_09516 [Paramyrothecium foliicola]
MLWVLASTILTVLTSATTAVPISSPAIINTSHAVFITPEEAGRLGDEMERNKRIIRNSLDVISADLQFLRGTTFVKNRDLGDQPGPFQLLDKFHDAVTQLEHEMDQLPFPAETQTPASDGA